MRCVTSCSLSSRRRKLSSKYCRMAELCAPGAAPAPPDSRAGARGVVGGGDAAGESPAGTNHGNRLLVRCPPSALVAVVGGVSLTGRLPRTQPPPEPPAPHLALGTWRLALGSAL